MMWAWALMAGAWGGAEDCARPLKGKPGTRKVALVVGVSDYLAEVDGSIDLGGPAADAERVRDLLVGDFGFPRGNVCVLVDRRATMKGLQDAWGSHLGRVSSGDTVVVFFAGHGSRSTIDGADTYLLHDSRTAGVSDLHGRDFEALVRDVYERTSDVTVWVDASHGPGPHDTAMEAGLAERWVAPVAVQAVTPESPGAPEMEHLVQVHAAREGMPALERDGQGIFTTALIQSMRSRAGATWHQITHDVARWVAALNSWQRPTASGALERVTFGTRGVQTASWTVSKVSGSEVRLQGPPLLGWSPGAVVAVVEGDKIKARVRLDGVSAGTAIGTLVGSGKKITVGDAVRLEVAGEDLAAIDIRIAPEVGIGPQILQALSTDAVLSHTVHVVEGSADFAIRAGPQGTVDIVGADGVRRNRLPAGGAEDATKVAQTLGLYARQASLLALSGEVSDVYPDDMFEVRILPHQGEGESCARTPYMPTERALPFAQVPMCNAVRLQITLLEDPVEPLYVGVLYLSGNGTIFSWPRGGKTKVLAAAGDQYEQVLGWVTPPLYTPDRLLVFGTHEAVAWSRLEAVVLPDSMHRKRGTGGPGFFVASVAGPRTRSAWAQGTEPAPAWTASLVTLEIVADPARWSDEERDTTSTCALLRKGGCAAAAPSE